MKMHQQRGASDYQVCGDTSVMCTRSNPIRTEIAKWSPIIHALGLGIDAPTRSASPRR